VANDPKVRISIVSAGSQPRWKGGACRAGAAVAAPPEVTQVMEKVFEKRFGPAFPLVATMSTWRQPTAGTRAIAGIPDLRAISCMFFDKNDSRAHGKDERVGVQDFLRRAVGLQLQADERAFPSPR